MLYLIDSNQRHNRKNIIFSDDSGKVQHQYVSVIFLTLKLGPDQQIVLCDDTRVSPEETIQADIGKYK